MNNLKGKISEDLKQAMLSKNIETTSVLRMLIAALRNKEIALRQGKAVELTAEQALETVSCEIKKRRDSVEAYVQGGRQELADKEAREIIILEKYLPEQLSEGELKKIILEIVKTPGNASVQKDFGKIMGQTMAKVKGQANGAKVGELVKQLLAK